MWGFSTDNAKRNPEEIQKLFGLFKKYLAEAMEENQKASAEEKKKYNVRIRFLGRRSLFPPEIQDAMNKIEGLTKNNKNYTLNLLLGYGGHEEIVDAVNALLRESKKEVDEKDIENRLYTAGQEHPDLVIRTSGEQRLSGLLPWQTVYSELHFSKKLWQDFGKRDFEDALKTYGRRMRRFGK